MLQNIKPLYGIKICAADGDIGHTKDFYFDDITWAIRYVVVDTGSWLSGRQVLLSPHAFGAQPLGHSGADDDFLRANLTRRQIEDSPSIESHRPVTRQYEIEYYRYYGWPNYWQTGGMWGVAGVPVVPLVTVPLTRENVPHHGHNQSDDIHLRSTKAVTGYAIQATDGPIGSVKGFTIDSKTWVIREVIVEAGRWYSGKRILILPESIDRISYEDSAVFVKLARDDIEQTSVDDVAQHGAARL